MNPRGIALIYDDTLRPDTTGGYCLRALQLRSGQALQKLGQVTHFQPSQLQTIPNSFGLYLCIDDGLDYQLPSRLHPAVFWAIDTHLNFDRALRRARNFDVVFAAQKEGAARLRQAGLNCNLSAGAEWLPLACDPEIHRRLELEKAYDVAFVGHTVSGERRQFLERLQRSFPNSFIGQAPHTQMAEIYSRARIVINQALNNDLNMRVFEALSCGAMLLTPQLQNNGQEELFQDKVHLVEYRSQEEALELVDYYLRQAEAREIIAQAGHREALAKHTYSQRMEQLLERVEEALSAPSQTAAPLEQQCLPAENIATSYHDAQYFHWPRPDLLALVPREAKRVLDLGCAAGVFGESLKRRQKCEVVGIEIHAPAAQEAEARLDRVLTADIEQLDLTPLGKFDAIVCGDILEHLRDPDALVRRLPACLSPDGRLIASFPNVRNIDVAQRLIEGNWNYEASGLLDRSHLRFFTKRSAEQLLEEAGFQITQVQGIPGPGHAGWEAAGRPGQIQAGRLGISGLPPAEAEEFFINQWLITAQPAPGEEWGLTSIIILTWNQLSYTQLCLESLRKHTPLPYELIVVDNGSTDGTVEWLKSQPDIHLICNATNQGFAKGCNQGIAVAQGENILLLNNDTVVTAGWLRRMLERLHSSPEVGMVGPLSNEAVGRQKIAVPYQNLIELEGFAWELGKHNRGRSQDTGMLVGFCLLIKRALLEKLRGLDERFEIGTFEDTDLCWRAIKAGYRLLICQDAFVHHYCSRTFHGNKLPVHKILEENQRRFEEKWGLAPGQTTMPDLIPSGESKSSWRIGRHPSGGLLLQVAAAARPQLSLCMIVRDEAPHIAACLESIRPYVDEMVVVDTGSQDATPSIARELGAKVIEIPWPDSFSAARNVSLDHATGEWIFWMDADDVITPESGEQLRKCIAHAPEQVMGFVGQVHCPAGPGEEGETVVDHVKLFRNRPEIRFELRMHEQILPSLRRAGGEVARAPIHITHANYDHTPQGQRKKRARDARLLALDLAENPQHPFVHFNIGMTALHEKDYPRALSHLRKSIDLSAPEDSQVRKAYALLASAYRALSQPQEALQVCREGRRIYPEDTELRFNEALAYQMSGDFTQAERTFQELLNQPVREDHLASVDTGIFSYKARHNLAVVYEQMGKTAEAEACWRKSIDEQPDFLPTWLALGELLINSGRTEDLAQLARQAERVDRIIAQLLRGRAALRNGELLEAEKQFRLVVKEAEHMAEGQRFLAHALLQRGERYEVEGVLRRLIELAPEDGEAHHNLASLLLELDRAAEAVVYYQQAVQLRPDYYPSQQMLQEAMRKLNAPNHSPLPGGKQP